MPRSERCSQGSCPLICYDSQLEYLRRHWGWCLRKTIWPCRHVMDCTKCSTIGVGMGGEELALHWIGELEWQAASLFLIGQHLLRKPIESSKCWREKKAISFQSFLISWKHSGARQSVFWQRLWSPRHFILESALFTSGLYGRVQTCTSAEWDHPTLVSWHSSFCSGLFQTAS